MKSRIVADQERYQRMTTAELRAAFLIEDLFQSGSVELYYTDVDRAVIGSIVPTEKKLSLGTSKEQLASEYFAERREIGLINTGAGGNGIVDGKAYPTE